MFHDTQISVRALRPEGTTEKAFLLVNGGRIVYTDNLETYLNFRPGDPEAVLPNTYAVLDRAVEVEAVRRAAQLLPFADLMALLWPAIPQSGNYQTHDDSRMFGLIQQTEILSREHPQGLPPPKRVALELPTETFVGLAATLEGCTPITIADQIPGSSEIISSAKQLVGIDHYQEKVLHPIKVRWTEMQSRLLEAGRHCAEADRKWKRQALRRAPKSKK